MVIKARNHLKSNGATGIVFSANTMHFIADRVEKEIGLPVIHIASATATEIEKIGPKKVGLLGTNLQWNLTFLNQN